MTNLTEPQVERVNQWVAELRSGKYNQTSGILKTEIGGGEVAYCCLGIVAEAVLGREFVTDHDGGLAYVNPSMTDLFENGILALEDRQSLGLDRTVTGDEHAQVAVLCEEDVTVPTRMDALIHLNDNSFSFVQIADFIEKMGWNK